MPLYDYKCSQCQNVTEIRHGFGERITQSCPQCGGALGRVFNPAPIVFKGSGFYITDSRGKSQKPGSETLPTDSAAKETAAPKDAPAKETPVKDAPAKSASAKDPAA